MPIRFNTSNEGVRADLDPVIPVAMPMTENASGYQQGTALNTGQAIGSIFSSLSGGDGEEALGAYSVEAAEIVGQTEGYAREKERILQGLSSAQDQQTVLQYSQQLARLRRGEVQGALDPMSANARINALTKKYINRHPALALKFRQIHNGISDDVTAVAGSNGREIDPDMAAINELVKRATISGTTVPEQMNIERAAMIDMAQEREFKAKSRLGLAAQADIAKVFFSKANVLYANLLPRMTAASKDPNFQGMNWYAELTAARGQLTSDFNLILQEAQLAGKYTLEADFQKRVVEQSLAPLDELIKIAEKVDNPKTREAVSTALRKIAENASIETLTREFGWITPLLGTEDRLNYMKDISDMSQKIAKGQLPQLEAIAQYDFYTKMMLDHLKSKGIEKFLAENAEAADTHAPRVPTGNPVLDKMNLQAQIDYAIRPTMSSAGMEHALTYIAGDQDVFEAYDHRKDLVNKTKGQTNVINTLRQTSNRLVAETADKSDPVSLQHLRWNKANPEAPFYLVPLVPGAINTPEYQKMLGTAELHKHMAQYGEAGYSYLHPSAYETVNRLNQQYRVFKQLMTPQELMKWVNNAYEGIQDQIAPKSYEEQVGITPSNAGKAKPVAKTEEMAASEEDAALAAEAAQAGMTVEAYKNWINRPAQ